MSCRLRCIRLSLRFSCAAGFIIGLSAITGCEGQSTVVSDLPGLRQARLEASQLSFGEVDATRDFEWTVRLANPSDSPIAAKLRTTCGCVSVEPESILVAPHDHVDVVMTLNLTPRDAATVNVPQWDFSAVLFADDEARPGSAAGRWEIRGTVNNPLQFDDPNPHFVVQTDEPASAARQSGLGTFAFRSHAALERVEVMQTAGETGLYSAEAIMKSASDGTVRLTFRDDADLPIGEFPTDVRLNCFPADGGTVIERTVPIHVTVRGRFEITPRNIVIGSQQAGSDAGTTVVVTPRESFNYEIVSLTCADESIAAEAVPRSDSRQPTTVVVRYGEPPETDNGAVGKTYLNVVLVLENGTTEARAIPVIVLPSARKKAVPVSNESGAVNSGGRSFVHL